MSRCKHGLEEPPEEWPDVPFTKSCYVCWRETHVARPVIVRGGNQDQPRQVDIGDANRGLRDDRKRKEPVQGMGDALKAALDMTGVTQERVKAVLGSCGGCPARQAMLNQLGWAAMRVLRGAKDAVVHFKRMLGEEEEGK